MTLRSRTARTTAAATLGLALVVGTGAAHAGLIGYGQDDPSGDVTITAKKGLPKAQRKSIDLAFVQVQARPDERMVDFLVQLKYLTDSKKFDQVVTFSLSRPEESQLAGVTFSPSPGDRRDGSAVRRTADGAKTCSDLTTQTFGDEPLALVSVPYKCVPDEAVEITVVTSTGTFHGDGPTFSRDRQVSDGAFQLR
ncbi:hypothetical protein [Nocardioides sp. AX2bis]|uniref:hypothetical protein n=1 Tax=Nocardioides sp. AX2bis TaxID=2653157 RepID=UPI0012F3A76D|nr:hypothetical protein [Nocardioides sp. AX2bis]VXB68541.1 conserved exported hypothetical protein [Nocardioides sp. AX2bis]